MSFDQICTFGSYMGSHQIISLSPAATEIIYALGLEQNLIGRSSECDYPESVKQRPICSTISEVTHPNKINSLNTEATSYTADLDMIEQLQPDVVIVQRQSILNLHNLEQALARRPGEPARIINVAVASLADVFANVKKIAGQLNVGVQGEDLLELLNERVDIIRHKLKFIVDKPTVACITSLNPLRLAVGLIPEMIAIAGGHSIAPQTGTHAFAMTWDTIKTTDPDILLVAPQSFAIEQTMKEIDRLLSLPGFADLKAVKNNRVYIADGKHYFNRTGPRIVDSIEILAEIIYPKQFIFGYEGNGWIRFAL